MTPQDIKAAIQADIQKTENDLKAKKILLKQVSKKPSKPFIETKVGRGWNQFLSFITSPCAATNRLARMKLDHPRAYRAEVTIHRAEKILKRLENEQHEVDDKTNKLAAIGALYETMLTEFADMDEYQEKILDLRQKLVLQVSRLRTPNNGPSADVANSLSELLEKLKGGLGKGPEGSPQGI